MKFMGKNIKAFIKTILAFSFCGILFPINAFALSNDPSQNFATTTCAAPFNASSWSIVPNSGTTIYTIQNGFNVSGASDDDPYDCAPQLYSIFYCSTGNPTAANAVTITYTDPAPSAPTTYIKFDFLDTNGNRSFQIIVNATNSHAATAFSDDIMPDCYESAPATTGTSGSETNVWQTGYVQLLGPGAQSSITTSDEVNSVQIIFVGDPEMTLPSDGGNPVYLDNIRGEQVLSCLTPTPTITPTPTGSATATPTITDTPGSPTNTPSITDTPAITNTPTITKTPPDTPTITLTPTITSTSTPLPCPVEVYPNPMDFTIAHNLSNAGGVCTAPKGQCIIFSCVPLGSTIKIYTISLDLVRVLGPQSIVTVPNLPGNVGVVAWDGTNGDEQYVSSGLYFYVVNGPGGNTFGKFAISKSHYGP